MRPGFWNVIPLFGMSSLFSECRWDFGMTVFAALSRLVLECRCLLWGYFLLCVSGPNRLVANVTYSCFPTNV